MAYDKETIEKAQTAFIRARVHLLSQHPFYAYLVMKLQIQWMEKVDGGLSMTDGRTMYVQPDAFLKLTPAQRVTDIVHEAYHVAAGHLSRMGGNRDQQKWNVAGDIVLDNSLTADGFDMSGPYEQSRSQWLRQNGQSMSQFVGMSAEQVYDELPDPPKQGGAGQCCRGGKSNGGGCFMPAKSEQEAQELASEWRSNVIAAGQLAGNAAGAWRELVKAAMPTPPWHLKMFEFLSRGVGGDTTWETLNRRWLAEEVYLPADTKQVMGEIVTVIDTSGSMSSEQITKALGYIRAFRDQHPCKLHLVQCDYDVPAGAAGYQCFDEWATVPAELEVAGRGGTSFDAPFKLLREKRIDPKAIIYLTDGYGSVSMSEKPPCQVLWVIVQGDRAFNPPFGEVVIAKDS